MVNRFLRDWIELRRFLQPDCRLLLLLVPNLGSGDHASHSEIHRRGRRGCAGPGLATVAQVKADVCANRDLRRLARRSLWRADPCEACRVKSLITVRGFAISAA